MKKGIDISYYQKNVDFTKVKNYGIEFVILREGFRRAVDTKFFEYAKQCKAAELPIMAIYHFSYALNADQAKEEAQLCVKNLQKAGLGKDVVIFFDFEYDTVTKAKAAGVTLDRDDCNKHAEVFCEEVKALGYIPGIYSNIDYYKNWYNHDLLSKYIFWLADYTGEPNYPCTYHQYSSKGHVEGIVGYVDMNYYYGESEQEEAPLVKTIDDIAKEVLSGKWGNGEFRKNALKAAGWDYAAVQKRVNALLQVKPAKKTVDEIAKEVLAGKWGNGEFRKNAIKAAGYDYAEVQRRVNAIILKG